MRTSVMWRAGVATDLGLERENNEDRVFVDEEAGVFLVVDGVGGQAAGEKAADVAVEVITNYLSCAEGPPERCVRESIAAANNEIFHLAESHQEWRGMACVLTLALAREDRVTVGHVGDSRLYLAWDGKLRKLTSDHSPIGEREDQGEISELEAMSHPRRNQVFRDVGSRLRDPADEDFIEVRSFPFHPDAALLLCSDGLSDTLPSGEISAIVEGYDGDPEKVSLRLVDATNRAGGKDNVSVVFVAGPEFPGSRARHAVTRVRRPSRVRILLSRMAWLAAGVALGIGVWNSLPRWLPRVKHSASISVNAGDPLALMKAFHAARPGDVIAAPAGDFFGPIEFKEGVTLISQKPGATTLRADPAAATDAGIAIAARGIHKGRISGLRIIGDEKSALAVGLLLQNSSIEIDDTEISGAADGAVRIEGASAAVLRADFIHDNAGCGVWIGGESIPRLVGNRISDNRSRAGIEIHLPAAPVIENNIIRGNGAPEFGLVSPETAEQLRRTNVVE